MVKVGILALQGDVREHADALESCGASVALVKTQAQLEDVDALVLPGGESTTIGKLLDRYELLDPLIGRASAGMPIYGTCAGAILMAREVLGTDPAPHRLRVMDIDVVRNAFGRQVDSFEADLDIDGLSGAFRGVFIRAPSIERVGEEVEVLAVWRDKPVLVRQGSLFASTFHPELTGDARIHRSFVERVEAA